jgi:transcriptional regulator with XRE-family HTH domain
MTEVKLSPLAEKLRNLRGDKSLYLVEKESGIYRGTLKKYESGSLIPENPMLERLSSYYKINVSVLLKLILEDLYPPGSTQRKVVIEWALERRNEI